MSVDAKTIATLRREAMDALRVFEGAERLPAILKKAGDPRLLDVRQDDRELPDSLLEFAIRMQDTAGARVLIESGADPMQSRLEKGFKSTHVLACEAHDMSEQIVRKLVDMLSAAGADWDAKTHQNATPLHYAIYYEAPHLAQILISRGVWIDPNLLDGWETEAKFAPRQVGERPRALETLRVVRALALERGILSAMPDEAAPAAKSTPAMTV